MWVLHVDQFFFLISLLHPLLKPAVHGHMCYRFHLTLMFYSSKAKQEYVFVVSPSHLHFDKFKSLGRRIWACRDTASLKGRVLGGYGKSCGA